MADAEITEVLVTAPNRIYTERDGLLSLSDVTLDGDHELEEVVERLLAPGGRRVDELSPMADSMLPDGSRVNVVIPPLALGGPPGVNPPVRLDASRARRAGCQGDARSASCRHPGPAQRKEGTSVLISGGTASGKTTLLAAIASQIPAGLRIVIIEGAADRFQLEREHVVRLQARPPGVGSVGEVTIRDLVRNAMRMRPDRLIVGEVRGPEALDLLGALNTGHRGVISTVHANSARDALDRVRDLAMLAGIGLRHRRSRRRPLAGSS